MKKGGNQRQTELRQEVIALVGQDEMAAFVVVGVGELLWRIMHIWLAVFATVLMVYVSYHHAGLAVQAMVSVVAMLFVATRINALNVLLHEGAHYNLLRNRTKNDACANWLIGYWTLFDIHSYRKVHLKHHAFLNVADDPDLPLYQKVSKTEMVKGVMKDLLLVTFFQRMGVYIRQMRQGHERQKMQFVRAGLLKVMCQMLLLAALCWLFDGRIGGVFYGLLWLCPLIALYPVIIRWKTLVEHSHPSLNEGESSEGGHIFVARTSEIGRLEAYLIGAQMQYHFEHHLFPELSFAQLEQLHQRLRDKGYFEKTEAEEKGDMLSGGYVHFLKQHWRQDA